jgi:hypothetical protein
MRVGLCCLLASGAFAQHRGGGGGGFGRGGGFVGGGIGRGGFIGGGYRGGFGRGFYGGYGRGFYGGFGRGFYGRGFYGRGFGYRGFYGGYWPGFYGGYYWPGLWGYGLWGWPDYDYGYAYPYYGGYYAYPDSASYGPNVTVVYPQPAEPVTPVVVTQPAQPVIHEYRQPEDYGLSSEREGRPVLYLIAFKDQVIRAATTYWVEGGTLHYLDMDHKEKQAPLSSVDQDFSARLNRERHVPFRLP